MGLRRLTASHRLAARAAALADARLGWQESRPAYLFLSVVGADWTDYGERSLVEIYSIYEATISLQPRGRK